MSVVIHVDPADLLRFARRVDNLRDGLDNAVTEALNDTGDGVARQITETISRETGFTIADAARFVTVSRANRSRKEYTIEVREGLIETERVGRNLPRRTFPGGREKDPDLVVQVNTMRDGKVCEICEEIAANGPYTMAELNQLKQRHPHFLNPQLHCRCQIQPFRPKGRLETRQRTGTGTVNTRETLHQLSERIRQQVRTTIRVR
jgi:hypothetical protein